MAGRGPVPKPPGTRNRRNAGAPVVTLSADDHGPHGFELPEGLLPGGEDWHPATRGWWSVWQRCPQAQVMEATDWSYLLDTALMHHRFWTGHRWELAAEIRLRLGKVGATVEDRARLRMELPESETPADAETVPAGVVRLDDRRVRLSTPGTPI